MELLEEYPEQKNYRFFEEVPVRIGAVSIKDEWDKKWKPHVLNIFDMFMKEFRLDKEGKPTINVTLVPLEWTEPDDTLND